MEGWEEFRLITNRMFEANRNATDARGRSDDLVICGGHNVYPTEVETEIDQLPGVTESAVIGARIQTWVRA